MIIKANRFIRRDDTFDVQSLFNGINEGDVVIFDKETYRITSIIIPSNITIIGINGATILSISNQDTFVLDPNAKNVNIEGLVFKGKQNPAQSYSEQIGLNSYICVPDIGDNKIENVNTTNNIFVFE